ncbi:MAG: Abi family protein [Lachnospiraceae bacterium]|nr:Abi family protein [Lachnospiraceae bacterium]
MSHPQEYKTVDEQIELLKSRNLSFKNENLAKKNLRCYGYYSIINGYKSPYLDNENGKEDHYKDGVTFEQIFSLFTFDHRIKSAVMLSMLDFEEHLRAVTAEVVANKYTSLHTEYLKPNHYQDRRARKESNAKFSRAEILKKMDNELHSKHNPIKYSMDKYQNVPPWILFKGIYFNTLVNFVRIQKGDAKTQIMCRMYNITVPSDLNLTEIKNLFTDSLFIFLAYRNSAAHGGRIYNLNPSTKVNFNKKLKDDLSKLMDTTQIDELEKSKGLWQVVLLLKMFSYNGPFELMQQTINDALTEHCSKYPQDIEYIANTTGIDINNIEAKVGDTIYKLSDFITDDGHLSLAYLDADKEVAASSSDI